MAYTPPLGGVVDFDLLSSYTPPLGSATDFELGEFVGHFFSEVGLMVSTRTIAGTHVIDVTVPQLPMSVTFTMDGAWARSFYALDTVLEVQRTVSADFAIDVDPPYSIPSSARSIHSSVFMDPSGILLNRSGMVGGFQIDAAPPNLPPMSSTRTMAGAVQIDATAAGVVGSTRTMLGTVLINVVASPDMPWSTRTMVGTVQIDVEPAGVVLGTSRQMLGGVEIDVDVGGIMSTESAIIGGYQVDVEPPTGEMTRTATMDGAAEITNLSVLSPYKPGATIQTSELSGWDATPKLRGEVVGGESATNVTDQKRAENVTPKLAPHCTVFEHASATQP